MKKFCLLVLFLLAPSLLWAQGVMNVSNIAGPVQIRSASSGTFVALSSSVRQVQVGDQIRTGDGGTVLLSLPDGSYMNVTPNSTVTIQDYTGSGFRTIANVLAGRVRFYIQKFGGLPNPYRVGTPTALIAVRGTIFDVMVEESSQYLEVVCREGQVGVWSKGLEDREVLLDAGKKTQVYPGQVPFRPIASDENFPNRQLRVVKLTPADLNKNAKGDIKLPEGLARDGDRGSRTQPGGSSPTLSVDPTVSRAKPGTLSYPK